MRSSVRSRAPSMNWFQRFDEPRGEILPRECVVTCNFYVSVLSFSLRPVLLILPGATRFSRCETLFRFDT